MKKIIIKLIDNYQKNITPYTIKRCKYFPTCSQYAKEAYTNFNFFYASFLTIKRIIKCNPLSKGGYDPIPLKKKKKK